ncbi:MAG: DUF1491 family protein [Methyloligellaceae bacterium]
MRVKAEIWVKSYIRRCHYNGAYAMVLRRGDSDAGAIFIKINTLDGQALLMMPAPAGFSAADTDRMWIAYNDGQANSEDVVDNYIEKQKKSDPDIWVVEVEDKDGRMFLEEETMSI